MVMVEDIPREVPLLGALLVTEGLVTMEQLDECLLIQQHYHPSRQIGQILLRYGYVTEGELEHVLTLQHEFRETMLLALEVSMLYEVGARYDQGAPDLAETIG